MARPATNQFPDEQHQEGQLQRPRAQALGVVSGALFVLALIAAPFAAATLTTAMADAGAFTFEASPASTTATLRAINRQSAALMTAPEDPTRAWSDMVARELAEGDRAAARGLMLSAGAMLGGQAREAARLRLAGDEQAALAAAIPLLSHEVAAQAQSDGLIGPRRPEPPAAMGDARDLALQARNWLEGRGQSLQDLVLTGVLVTTPDLANRLSVDPVAFHTGAAVVKAALRQDGLAAGFRTEVSAILAAVEGEGALRSALRNGLASDAALLDEPGTIRAAFLEGSQNTPTWQAAAALLVDVSSLTQKVGAAGAVRLLNRAQSLQDLPRLQLLAAAGGDQAVALAKRQSSDAPFLSAAKADVTWTLRMQLALGVLALCLLTILAAPLVTVAHAVSGAWDAPARRQHRAAKPPATPGQQTPAAAPKRQAA
jgi:hypothetical protein